MTSVENPDLTKKPRRRQSLAALVEKIGREPRAIEQAPDGTVRLLFADATAPDQSTTNLDKELADWEARRGQVRA